MTKTGTFIMSIDVELDEESKRYWVNRQTVRSLLLLMEEYNIKGTWAMIGNRLPPPSNETQSQPAGSDVLFDILNCKVPQEIGCHTYSHIKVGDPSCTLELFCEELSKCRAIADSYDIPLRSFVFPFNSVGHLDCLEKYGIFNYRGPASTWYASYPGTLRRMAHLIDHWLLVPPSVVSGTYTHKVWNLPASYFYACGSGWKTMIPISLRVNKAKKGLQMAVEQNKTFHIWFHPFNFADNPERWLDGLRRIFIEVNKYRDSGQIQNLTMYEMTSYLNSSISDIPKETL